MEKFRQPADENLKTVDAVNWSVVDQLALSAGTSARYTIPSGTKLVKLSCPKDFYVRLGGSTVDAVVPAAGITDGTGSFLNPTFIIDVSGITHIAAICADATYVTIMRWK